MHEQTPHLNLASTPNERRRHGRLAVIRAASLVISDDIVLSGTTTDISFRGAKITLEGPLPSALPEHCRLMIVPDDAAETIIDVHAKIERVTHDTLSLQFFSTDLRSYNHLRNLLLLKSRQREQLLQELSLHPGVAVA